MSTHCLESKLSYVFKDKNLLSLALTHASAGTPNNERLEFLGDSILDAVISKLLYDHHPDANEGKLSRNRASLVNQSTLSEVADWLELGEYVVFGKSEILDLGKNKPSITSSTLEAVIGAIYQDGGWDEAFWVIERLFAPLVEDRWEKVFCYKTELQEIIQKKYNNLPKYSTVSIGGLEHSRKYRSSVSIDNRLLGSGEGGSKKEAEKMAAEHALSKIDLTLGK